MSLLQLWKGEQMRITWENLQTPFYSRDLDLDLGETQIGGKREGKFGVGGISRSTHNFQQLSAEVKGG